MSGVLLSVGMYAILRFKPVVDLAAGAAFAGRILLAFGLLSMAVAALFLWTTQNFKDRKSTRLNSSHSQISYAVFCLKKKIKNLQLTSVRITQPLDVCFAVGA